MHTKRRKEREKEGQLLHLWERGEEGGKGGGKSRLPTALHPTMEGDAKQTDGLYWIFLLSFISMSIPGSRRTYNAVGRKGWIRRIN